MDRSLMTAQCVATGLFPPSEKEIWNESLKFWQPIPIHTVPVEQDVSLLKIGVANILDPDCPRRGELLQEYLNSSKIAALLQNHSEFIGFLEKNSGHKNPSLSDIYNIYDALRIQKLKDFE